MRSWRSLRPTLGRGPALENPVEKVQLAAAASRLVDQGIDLEIAARWLIATAAEREAEEPRSPRVPVHSERAVRDPARLMTGPKQQFVGAPATTEPQHGRVRRSLFPGSDPLADQAAGGGRQLRPPRPWSAGGERKGARSEEEGEPPRSGRRRNGLPQRAVGIVIFAPPSGAARASSC